MGNFFKNRLIISTSLAAILVLAGCSGSDDSSDGGSGGSTPPPASSIATGKGVDGYIAGAHLYADIDGNHAENSGDLSTTTDDNGNFTFSASVEHGKYLYLSGGTDVVTNSAFAGVLSASYQGETTVISPLSTMVVALMQHEGLSYEDAVARIASAMDLETTQVVADPYAQPSDITLFVASQRVVSAATTLGGDFTTAVQALATADMNVTKAANSLGVPPTEVEAVDAYLQDLGPRLPLGATAEELAAFQNEIDTAIDDPSNIPSAEDSATVSNAYGCLEFTTIKGHNSSESNITSDLNITACDARNPDATLTWSSSDSSVITANGAVVRPVYTATTAVLEVSIVTDTVSRTRSYNLTIPRLDNHLPVSVADHNTTSEETSISFNVLANDSDVDGDALTLVAVSDGVAFNADGRVTYTPEENFNGLFSFNYRVKDSWGDEVNATASITVTPVNDTPQLAPIVSQPQSEDFGVVHLTINATDDDTPETSLTYSVVSVVPAIVNASFSGNELDLTSKQDLNGDANITVMVSDGDSNSTRSFVLTVTPVDDAPLLSTVATPTPVDEDDAPFTLSLSATDVDDTNITYSAVSSDPMVLTVSVVSNELTISPVAEASGSADVTITATANGLSDTKVITVTINAVDDAPVLSPLAPVSIDEDSGTYSVTAVATDVDNNDSAITYTLVSTDTSILSVSGMDLVTVSNAYGDVDINVTATSNGLTDTKVLRVHVIALNDAPQISATPVTTVNQDDPYAFNLNGTDVDTTDVLTYHINNAPSWIHLDPQTGHVMGTPTNSDVGVYDDVNITVTDGNGSMATLPLFSVTVVNINDAPQITGTPSVTVDEDSPYHFSPVGTDIDVGDILTYNIANNPGWMNIDPSSGEVTGTPENADVGIFSDINISVRDGNGSVASLPLFNVTVVNANDVPEINGTAITSIDQNASYSFTVTGTDVDLGDTLHYVIANNPTWMRIDARTGEVSGIPANADVGVHSDINVSVVDGNGSVASLPLFDVTVININDAPRTDSFIVPVPFSQTDFQIPLSGHVTDIDVGDTFSIDSYDFIPGLDVNGTQIFSYDSNATGGTISFYYTVADGNGSTASGTITLIVSDPIIPVAADDTVTVVEDDPGILIDVLSNDTDADSIGEITVQSSEGVATIESGQIRFVPNHDAYGLTSIKYKARSTSGHLSNEATVDINITSVNDAPVIQVVSSTDFVESNESKVYVIDLNITDVDNNMADLTIQGIDNGGLAFGEVNATKAEILVPAYYNGSTNLQLRVGDGNTSTVRAFAVNVTAVDSAAVITNTDVAPLDVSSGTINFPLGLMPENENFTLSVESNTSLVHVAIGADNRSLDLTPISGVGDEQVVIRAVNDNNNSLVVDTTIYLHVSDPNNIAPVANNGELSVVVDDSLQTDLSSLGFDDNGDPLMFSIVTPPVNGTVTMLSDGFVTYVASGANIGDDDSFSYKINDGQVDSNIAMVTVHVISSTNDNDENSKIVITEADFNATTAQPLFTDAYSVSEYGWDNTSYLIALQYSFNATNFTMVGYYGTPNMSVLLTADYTLDTDGRTALLDFNSSDSIDVDTKLRVIENLTSADLMNELNLSLPAETVGYKIATLQMVDEYNEHDEPQCGGRDENGTCTLTYTSLDDFIVDNSYDPDNQSMGSFYIDNYRFKFAQDSNLSNGVGSSGTIVRVTKYRDYNLNEMVEVVTNTNAGTWEYVYANEKYRIKVMPSVYNIASINAYQLSDKGEGILVYSADLSPAGSGEIETWYDENTMYHIANSIMNVDVNMSGVDLPDTSGEFVSFNTLPTEPFVENVAMYAVRADFNGTDYEVNVHGLNFSTDTAPDGNYILYMTDTKDGDVNLSYTLNGDIATINGMGGIDGKVTAVFTTAAELAAESGLPESMFATSTHQGYRVAHVESNDNGSDELRFDENTKNAVVNYLQTEYNNNNASPIYYDSNETLIKRDVEAVAFTNSKMYRVEHNINQATGERNVSREYIWLNGNDSSGNFVVSNDAQTYTYTSSDGKIATINNGTNDVYLVKVNEELNATQLMNETGLFLPMSAAGYRISYMDLDNRQGGTEIKLDDATVGYLESYYKNNQYDAGNTPVPTPSNDFTITMDSNGTYDIDFMAHFSTDYGTFYNVNPTLIPGLSVTGDSSVSYTTSDVEESVFFDYNIISETMGSLDGRITINVVPGSITPTTMSDSAVVDVNSSVNIDVLANDLDASEVVNARVYNRDYGNVVVEANNTITYYGDTDSSNVDITYLVRSATGNESLGSVSVTINH